MSDNHKSNKGDSAEIDDYALANEHRGDQFRLINPDGTFNIERRGVSSANLYEKTLSLSWLKIIVFFMVMYFATNSIFGLIFMMLGAESVNGLQEGSWFQQYIGMVHFSTQTFTTVGYGHMSPNGNAASILSSIVAFVGLISFAILTGLSFAKFSKPTSHILFSDNLLLAPNPNADHNRSLQFRVVNATKSQIIDLEARVTLAWLENVDGRMRRKFKRLNLELNTIHLFPLNWTIVHNLDEESPLHGMSAQMMNDHQMEILILIKGFDDTYSQIIHSKRSYSCTDLIEGARFLPMYDNTKDKTILSLSKLSEYEKYEF